MLFSDSDIPQYGMRSNRLDSVGDYITSRRGSLSDLVFSSQNKLSRDSVFLSNKKTRTVSMATISRHLSLEQPSLTGIARETRSKTLVPEKRSLMKTKSSRELVSFASTPNAAKRNSKELVKTPLLLKRKRSMRKIQSMKAFDSLLCRRRKLHRFKVNSTYSTFRIQICKYFPKTSIITFKNNFKTLKMNAKSIADYAKFYQLTRMRYPVGSGLSIFCPL